MSWFFVIALAHNVTHRIAMSTDRCVGTTYETIYQ